MKIFIDIGHPAHVHYFKNFIRIMLSKGHEISVIARDKEVTHKLLAAYKIEFNSRGAGGKGLIKKLLYFIEGDYKIYHQIKLFKPDLLLSFASPYLAQVSKLTSIPNIVLDDTEHNKWNHRIYVPFSEAILNPSFFYKNLGKKQIFFKSYMELCYLHPKYFNPDPFVLTRLRIEQNTRYVILRFVSWDANHDIGEKGLSFDYKLKLVKELSKNYSVYISSEGELPDELKKYKIKCNPEDLHSILYYAQLYIGEGSTTASECSVIGTPNIYVNSLFVSNCNEQEKLYGLSYTFKSELGVLEKAKEILAIPNLKEEWQKRRARMLADKIDVTAFMVWFIEHYPESVKVMRENPEYQYNFR